MSEIKPADKLKTATSVNDVKLHTATVGNDLKLQTAAAGNDKKLQTAAARNDRKLQTATAVDDKKLQTAAAGNDKKLQTATGNDRKLQTVVAGDDKKSQTGSSGGINVNTSAESGNNNIIPAITGNKKADWLKTGTVSNKKYSFKSAKEFGREIKTAVKKADKNGIATTALTSAGVAAKIFKGADRTNEFVMRRLRALSPRYIKRKFNQTVYRIDKNIRTIKRTIKTVKSTAKSVKNKAKTAKKVLSTPITQQNVKKAAESVKKAITTSITPQKIEDAAKKALEGSGKLIKTSTVVGAGGMLKTARIGAAGYRIAGNSLSKSNNESAAVIGNAINFSRRGTKAVSTSFKTTTGTAKAGVKALRTIKGAAKSIKIVGLKRSAANFMRYAVRRIKTQTIKFAKGAAQFVVKRALIPAVIIISIIIGTVNIITIPIQAVSAFLESAVGWIFAESDIAGFDEARAFQMLVARVNAILADTSYQDAHINSLSSIFPAVGNGRTVPAAWEPFAAPGAVARANQQIRDARGDVREIASELRAMDGVTYGGFSYEASINYTRLRNDFKINNHVEFLCMAFFTKYPFDGVINDDDDEAFDDINLSFRDIELKLFLLFSNNFTPVENGLPILKNRLDIEVRIIENWEITSIDPLRERVNLIIQTRFFPRLEEVDVNPRSFMPDTEENQDFFDVFDFAVEFINEIISGG